ncbi:methyl-accepting chemotaxis protein [Pseudomonas sp.]|uniref:methyl-accepting chemotaxis protein n=1 Tax=Pseudomonas sp. TaxID=306 RepID=UPI002CBA220B|nr:methyl-accepting chemotaxis protein [Pseudomonas sp.]HUE92258.1 methyl-accepting chemotaxis protein [Pseudomonas sp.]
MPFDRLNIQWRISLLSGFCLLAVVVVLLGATLYQTHQNAELLKREGARMLGESAQARLEESAAAQGLRVERFFDEARLYGEGFANQVLQLREQSIEGLISAEQLRHKIVAKTQHALREKPQMLGIYVVLLPDALDDQDSRFVNQPAAAGNETGRFALYWSQSEPGQLAQAVLTEANITTNHAPPGKEPENAWYVCPMENGTPCVVEPYSVEVEGHNTLMSSISLPLIEEGKVLGVIGIDISLKSLQKLTETLGTDLYQGQGEISIVSASGLLAGHSASPDELGKPFATVDYSTSALEVLQPLHPSNEGRSWELRIRVPHNVLQAPALDLQAQLDQKNRQATWQNLSLGIFASGLGLLLIRLTAVGITRPLLRVAEVLDAIVDGDGDLTQRIPNVRNDELGRLANGFNRFLEKLQPIVGEIQKVTRHTRDTADRGAMIAKEINAGMHRQHREVDQAATALQQISANAQAVAQSSSRAAESATAAEQASQKGLGVFDKTTECIARLDHGVELNLKDIQALAESSKQIGQVLDVICSIAEQTNLLALNAAIEAARAGEQGRGFAVVADEVRHLASHTQNSVGKIREVVETLQRLTHNVVESMQLSRNQARQSVELVAETHTALLTIGDAVAVIDQMNRQIASAAEEQCAVVEEITRRVRGIRDISEALTTRIEESSQMGQSLNDMASHQQRLVEHFRT